MRPLKVGSLFSGVGGFEMGFERAGFVTRWQCEIDPDATSVLERHWPNVRRYRDVTEVDPADLEPVDVITFGSPCQGFSVAGTRGGLDDHRSGLFGEAIRIIRGLRPAVAVWENVPGAFSTDDGRDFGAVLAALAESGALDIAWRVLDAQWFGVPQRRRRIFLVADFGGERAAQVLFESSGVPRDSQAGREAWEGTAPDAEGGTGSSDELVPCLMASGAGKARTGGPDFCVPDVAFTLAASGRHSGDGHGNAWNTTYLPVDLTNGSAGGDIAGTLTTELEHGNRGQFVAVSGEAVRDCLTAHGGSHGRIDAESETFVVASAVTASAGHHGHSSPRGDGSDNLIALNWQHVAADWSDDMSMTLSTTRHPAVSGMPRGVRRLTPVECERLMGWPDDHTRWRGDGREISDGPRYRMCGNGVVANVAEWIARRLRAALEAS